MALSLKKGEKVNLSKNMTTGIIKAGLGWDVKKYDGQKDFDLDVSVFVLDANGKATSEKDIVFYGAKKHPSGAIEHMGDNRTGAGSGDDEVINVDLSKIPSYAQKLVFVVTIYEDADPKTQNFGQIENAYIRLINKNGEEELRFDLSEEYSSETAVNVAELYLYNGEWKFKAVGEGFNKGLADFCGMYGIEVQ